jgi:hypothetical protein
VLNSEWLDIAIGVVFVWFLLAITVTFINESITRLLAVRSKLLWKTLHQMLDGTESPQGLLKSALKVPFWPGRPANPAPPAAASVTEQLYATQTVQALETRTSEDQKTRISNLPSKLFSQALMELASLDAGEDPATQITDLLASEDVPTALSEQLTALWTSVNRDVTKFSEAVAGWFDAQMTRLSSIYKSQVRLILVPVGIAVAIFGFALGARTDALRLVDDLQHDSNFRNIVVASASDAANTDLVKAGCPQSSDPQGADRAACEFKGAQTLKNIDIVITTDTPSAKASNWDRLTFLVPWSHPKAALGVLITGIAISFGATFWYDLLRRLVGIRGAPQTVD